MKIVSCKQERLRDNDEQKYPLDNLRVAKLIQKELSCLAIKWEKNGRIQIFAKELKEDEAYRKYLKISDFLYFISELEEQKMIKIQAVSPDSAKDEYKVLYDKEKVKYNPTITGVSYDKDAFELMEKSPTSKKEYFIPNFLKISNISIAKYLENYVYNKIIYPLPLLEDYVKNDFKTVEQRNFEKQLNDANKKHNEQMNEARKSLCTSRWSFLIATITLFLSTIFDISSCCSDTKRNDIHNTVIEQNIPRAISTNIANDTFKRIVIDKTNPMT